MEVQNLDTPACDEQLCQGRGACVRRDGEEVCECFAGYSGPFCQDGVFASLRTPLTYAAIGLVAAVIAVAMVIGVRRSLARRYLQLLLLLFQWCDQCADQCVCRCDRWVR